MKNTQYSHLRPGSSPLHCALCKAALLVLLAAAALWAASGGSLSGTLKDPSGAVLPGAKLTLVNSALKTEFTATSDGQGFYSFPNLAVGHYDLTIEAAGFKTQKKTDITVDADAAVRVDATLAMSQQTESRYRPVRPPSIRKLTR